MAAARASRDTQHGLAWCRAVAHVLFRLSRLGIHVDAADAIDSELYQLPAARRMLPVLLPCGEPQQLVDMPIAVSRPPIAGTFSAAVPDPESMEVSAALLLYLGSACYAGGVKAAPAARRMSKT